MQQKTRQRLLRLLRRFRTTPRVDDDNAAPYTDEVLYAGWVRPPSRPATEVIVDNDEVSESPVQPGTDNQRRWTD